VVQLHQKQLPLLQPLLLLLLMAEVLLQVLAVLAGKLQRVVQTVRPALLAAAAGA
jgi:hypothetical protein